MLAAPAYMRRYRAFLRARQPALVHANSMLTMAEALVARREGIPTVLHVHEMLPLDLRGRLLRRAAWERLDQVVAVSAPVRRAARLARAPAASRLRGLADAGRPDGDPRPAATVHGRHRAVVSPRKGSDLFVDAASLLLERDRQRFRFEMVGAAHDAVERDWARKVLARARDVGIHHIPQTRVFERLAQWDAFVLPSRSDPFPISMLEAMASGLPVVGTRRDGIGEQIAGGTGLLIEPEDPRALADAIAWCADQPAETRRRMGTAARGRVDASFTLEHQAAALDDAYRATWRTRRPRAQLSSTSLCTTRGATSSREAMWRAMRSATVTERWRPPVQPIAIVRCVLPSAM